MIKINSEDAVGKCQDPLSPAKHHTNRLFELYELKGIVEQTAEKILRKFKDILEKNGKEFSLDAGHTHLEEMDVVLTDETPMRALEDVIEAHRNSEERH